MSSVPLSSSPVFPAHAGGAPAVSSVSASASASMVALRLLVGLYYLPHVWSKISGFAGTVVFFGKAGFHPAEAFVVFSGAMELAVGLALVFGMWTRYAAVLSSVLLLVAAYAMATVNGLAWYWNVKGIEYLLFWAAASAIVCVDAWRRQPGGLRSIIGTAR